MEKLKNPKLICGSVMLLLLPLVGLLYSIQMMIFFLSVADVGYLISDYMAWVTLLTAFCLCGPNIAFFALFVTSLKAKRRVAVIVSLISGLLFTLVFTGIHLMLYGDWGGNGVVLRVYSFIAVALFIAALLLKNKAAPEDG